MFGCHLNVQEAAWSVASNCVGKCTDCKVLFWAKSVRRCWKNVQNNVKTIALSFRRTWILLKLLMAPKRSSWALSHFKLSSWKEFVLAWNLVHSWKLLLPAKRTWNGFEILLKSNTTWSTLFIRSLSERPWICGNWRFWIGQEMLHWSSEDKL